MYSDLGYFLYTPKILNYDMFEFVDKEPKAKKSPLFLKGKYE